MCIPDGWQLTDKLEDCWREDVKFWNKIKECWEPRKKNHHGVPFSPHIVYIVPFPDIPKGYRLANPEEHTRKDVKLWLTTSNAWIPRIPSYEGTKFDEKELYIVPLDLPTYSSPGKEKTPMQRKLTEYQIELLNSAFIQLRDFGLSFDYKNTPEGSDYWRKVLNNINDKRLNGTSDGMPYVEPTPEIPEGYRLAEPDEYKRGDVLFWWIDYQKWQPRSFQGSPFDDSNEGTIYIVPVNPTLTDKDACVHPRLLLMVRSEDKQPWRGPYPYIGKSNNYYYVLSDDGLIHGWSQGREATQTEIENATWPIND